MMLRWLSLLVLTAAVEAAHPDGLFDEDLYRDVLDPELCGQQLININPVEFYDASFRIPQGILTGSFSGLGEYNQCLGISQQSAAGAIQGKYCMVGVASQGALRLPQLSAGSWPTHVGWTELNVTDTMNQLRKYESVISKYVHLDGDSTHRSGRNSALDTTISLALCIPKACSVHDILGPVVNNSVAPFSYTEHYCRLPHDKPLVGADYTAMAILSIIGLVTILSTGYDVYSTFIIKKDPGELHKLHSCCSVYRNTRRLFTFTANPASLDCLDGLRSITILWIILGHVYVNYLLIYASNLLGFFEWYGKKRAIWLISADASVDTFYALSGLLVAYITVNKMKQKSFLFNIHWFYLHRLLRLFPLLALGVLLQASVFFRVTDGPNWWFHAKEVDNCRQYWWSALLHVQNWVNLSAQCLPQTWYLSIDMQLHIASPLLLYWILGSRRTAWSAMAVGLIVVLAANIAYCFVNNFQLNTESFRNDYYFNILIRAPPFIIGIICGYFLSIVRGKNVHMSLPVVATGYLLALVGSSYAMYQAYPEWNSSVIHNLNLSLEKSLWAMSVCWIVFACECGYGGPINWFLSLTIWKFPARISYALYLYHHSVMYMHGASLTTPFYYNMENIWFTFAAVTAYTTVVSVAACVLVEAPCLTLQNMMMSVFTKPAKTKLKRTTGNEKEEDIRVESGQHIGS